MANKLELRSLGLGARGPATTDLKVLTAAG